MRSLTGRAIVTALATIRLEAEVAGNDDLTAASSEPSGSLPGNYRRRVISSSGLAPEDEAFIRAHGPTSEEIETGTWADEALHRPPGTVRSR